MGIFPSREAADEAASGHDEHDPMRGKA